MKIDINNERIMLTTENESENHQLRHVAQQVCNEDIEYTYSPWRFENPESSLVIFVKHNKMEITNE